MKRNNIRSRKFLTSKRIKGKLTKQQIVQMYEDGKTAEEIATIDGIRKPSILNVLHSMGTKMRPSHRSRIFGDVALAVETGCAVQTVLRYKVIKYLRGRCRVCGESDPRVLHLNHINGKTHKIKSSEIQSVLSGKKTDIDVRCANHNILYEYERGKIKNLDPLFKALGLKKRQHFPWLPF